MLFNSLEFLVFFPIVVALYFIMPRKWRYIWLLIASYYFYMCWNVKYVLLLFFSTFVTYMSGVLIERVSESNKQLCKWVVAGSFVINLAILFSYKYLDFLIEILNGILGFYGIGFALPEPDLLLPVGISFYTFQALSYTVDVYRGDVKAEKNLLKYALFVSFFPQLVAGPIERSKHLLEQVQRVHEYKFEFTRVRDGLLLMLWGYFLKLVMADRIAVFVNAVYGNYSEYGGWYLIVATILFAFQIYGDFAGYSTIAMGAAEIMGFELMDNFNCPYFAKSFAEFWRRWHISLSSWFKDYLYIPLGGNKRGTIRKYLNILLVFLTSGLWHGANWSFVIWGGLNGVFQIIGDALQGTRKKICALFHLDRDLIGHKIFQTVFTFAGISFCWIFFRASDVNEAFEIIKSIFTVHNPWILFDDSLYTLGLDIKNFHLMVVCIVLVMLVDYAKYKGIVIRSSIQKQALWCRWLCYIYGVAFIVLFGIWGNAYIESSFIYFQF